MMKLTYKHSLKKAPGFTMIELLVVTTIMVVLFAVGVVAYSNASKTARDVKRRSDLDSMQKAMMVYKTNTGAFPYQSGYTFQDVAELLVADGYLNPPYPTDPLSQLSVNSVLARFFSPVTFALSESGGGEASYEYGYAGSTTAFCFCGLLENGNGNSTTGATDTTCSGMGEPAAGNTYYCTKNQ